jgi:hypothetical protein
MILSDSRLDWLKELKNGSKLKHPGMESALYEDHRKNRPSSLVSYRELMEIDLLNKIKN